MKKKILTVGICAISVCFGLAFAGCEMGASEEKNQLDYERVENGYAVVGIGDCTDGDLAIPETYKGEAVVAISENAFAYNAGIGYLTVPDSVERIGENAFLNCSNLMRVSLGENVKNIEASAFAYCSRLEECTLSASLESISEKAFIACSRLKEIEFPATITTISESAFEECRRLTNVTFNSGHFFDNIHEYICGI